MQKGITQGFRLSPQQKHVWLLQQADHSLPHLAQCAILIEGDLSKKSLKLAIENLVNRHEALRTTFNWLPGMGVPLQVITEGRIAWGKDCDLSNSAPTQQQQEIETLLREALWSPPAPDETSPLNLTLLALQANRHVLLVSLPSLSADAVTLENLVREISRSYAACLNGQELDDEPMQYVVASEWLNELLESKDAKPGIKYWQKQSASALDAPKLPFEQESLQGALFKTAVLSSSIAPETRAKIEELAGKYDVSPSTFLFACWQILLSRMTGQSDLVVGLTLDGRSDEELKETFGLFERCLPVECSLEAGAPFHEAMKQVDQSAIEASEWQDCFTWDQIARSANKTLPQPFLAYGFEFKPCPVKHTAADVTFSLFKRQVCSDRFKVKLSCIDAGNSLITEFHFDSELFQEREIKLLAERFDRLVESAANGPDTMLGKLDVLGNAERRQLLREFNDTEVDYAKTMLIHELFEQQAERTPNNVAVVFDNQQLNYKELNERANQLSHYLRSAGVGPETLVAICMERSLDIVVSLLGILKAGGAYLPLDPSLPKERLAYMLDDAQSSILLTQEHLLAELPAGAARVITVDADWEIIAGESKLDHASAVSPDNLAYVIYTSGSTGKPKGVMISHRSICNRLLWMQDICPLTEADSVLQKTLFSFDASIWEFYLPLFSGARVVLARPDGHQDPAYMVKVIAEQKVTTLQLVPSMLQVFLDEQGLEKCDSLKRVFCGGEALPMQLQERLFTILNADLRNLYGPTEVSIDASSWHCKPESLNGNGQKIVPIGHPIANMQIHLLDEHLQPVPIGAVGELHVGGVGLARGYLNQQGLTAEKFIPNPFSQVEGARLYKTGDLARYFPDGTIEFIGRRDHQVKIRGFRIELGEIEAVMMQNRAVKEAVAIAREDDPGKKRLVAYVVPYNKNSLNAGDRQLYRLPNNLEIAHLNKNETDLLYKEIFEDEAYLKHGITLRDGDSVFDVGSNIGLFTMFVHHKCRDARVFSFEPIPTTFEALRANVELYDLNVKPYQCGLSNEMKTAEFTFYPKVSASSGMYADAREDEGVTRAFMQNQGELLTEFADELLEGRFDAQKFTCQLRTVSDIISENNVERIDLLKVDVEKSELDVLKGIKEGDWKKIKQVVMEVHDKDGRLQAITSLLERHGFNVVKDQYLSFENTGLYDIYAVHPSRLEQTPTNQQGQQSDLAQSSLIKPTLAVAELRAYINERLPDYMVPSAIVVLEQMPLTSNGKIDRRALPVPDLSRSDSEGSPVAPRTPVEEMLTGIWAEVLGVEQIGIHDNFFDLGGHSLLATQLVSRLRKVFQAEVSLRSLFEEPTIAGLSKIIDRTRDAGEGLQAPPILRVSRETELPLSFAQQRLWFLDQLEPMNSLFNVPAAIRLKGPLNASAFEKSLNEIVRRHEILRTRFVEVKGRPVQVITEAQPVSLPVLDLSNLPEAEREARCRQLAEEESQRPFDLAEGPHLRTQLLRLGQEDHVMLFTMHHIISDGWSMGVLLREVTALYESFSAGKESPLPELSVQYADFASWQREWLQGEVLEKQLGYWTQQLGGKLPVVDMPTDRPRPSIQSYRGARQTVIINRELSEQVKDLSRKEGATLFMTLLASFYSLLYRYTGQEELVVGTDVANRNHDEIEGLIGFFINQLVMRGDLSGNPTFQELLARVREVALGAYAHQDLPFDKLVETLKPERVASRAPLFQVKMILQNTPIMQDAPDPALEPRRLTSSPLEAEISKTAKLDMNLIIEDTPQGLVGSLEYSTDLFDASTITRFLGHFETILECVAAQPATRLDELVKILDEIDQQDAITRQSEIKETRRRKLKNIEPKPIAGSKSGVEAER